MAGFLDKNSRIVDVVLTNYGREVLSQGQLDVKYWILFDDEVDYDPFISQSGSMTDAQLSASIQEQIENAPVLEAMTGRKFQSQYDSDSLLVRAPLYDMPLGQSQLPRMTDGGASSSGSIEVKQRRVKEYHEKKDKNGKVIAIVGPFDRGIIRFDSTSVPYELKYEDGSWPAGFQTDGFFVRVFSSGSDGLIEVKEKRDSSNNISFNNDLILKIENQKTTFNSRKKK